MTKHRMTKAVTKIIRFIALEKSNRYSWQAVHAGEIHEHLESVMENPPSKSTITRILQQLTEDGYLQHHDNRTDWFISDFTKDLWRPYYEQKRREREESQGDSAY